MIWPHVHARYERQEHDLYTTEPWATEALLDLLARHSGDWFGLPQIRTAHEPAAGLGHIVRVLEGRGIATTAADIVDRGVVPDLIVRDFCTEAPAPRADLLITNPPFGARGLDAVAFWRHAHRGLRMGRYGLLALLLPATFAHAKSRRKMFDECPEWAGAVALAGRIRLFDDAPGQRSQTPKQNPTWFLWSRQRRHPPVAMVAGPTGAG